MTDIPQAAPQAPPASPPGPRPAAGPAGFFGNGIGFGRAGKLVLVGLLLLGMMVPHAMVDGVITEREYYGEQVKRDVAASWGPDQAVVGPVLVVPTRRPAPRNKDETGPLRWTYDAIAVAPAELRAEARIAPERRRRSLFEAVVYEAEVSMTANLTVPDLSLPEGTEALWSQAVVVAGASDLRGAGPDARMMLGDRRLAQRDAAAGACTGAELLHWNAGLGQAPEPGAVLSLSGALSVRGTGSFAFRPVARLAELTATSPWASPGFSGAGLPVRSDVGPEGFSARWREGSGRAGIRALGDDWCAGLAAAAATVGVDLLPAVPTYRMVSRSSKYAAMFLALAFLTYVMFELMAGVRIHLVQYGLLGLSVTMFPLLLLAFGEPLGFAAAYAITTLAVLLQASIYTAAVTRQIGLASVFGAILGGLFAFLYVVLSLESFALLAGTVALFAILSVVMALTRRLDWSRYSPV